MQAGQKAKNDAMPYSFIKEYTLDCSCKSADIGRAVELVARKNMTPVIFFFKSESRPPLCLQ